MGEARRKVVLGVGNTLCRDEGVGVHLVEALRVRLAVELHGVEWVDGGTLGLRLLSVVETSSHMLVLDAVDAQRPPGTVVELSGPELAAPTGPTVSGHEIGLAEVLGLAGARQRLPRHLSLVGVQPGDMSMGLELSEPVAQAVPAALDAAECVVRRWQ
jgi:hydrogenase maturation protease